MLSLNFPIKDLKKIGYTFQKLYANNYKTYRKLVGNYKVWVWVASKSVEVNDWFDYTSNIIEYYKSNKDIPDKVSKSALKVQLNPNDGTVQAYDYEEYYKVFDTKDWTNWIAKYEHWHNEIYLFHDDMIELIKEIELLTIPAKN